MSQAPTVIEIEIPADLNRPVTLTITPIRPEQPLPLNSPTPEGSEA